MSTIVDEGLTSTLLLTQGYASASAAAAPCLQAVSATACLNLTAVSKASCTTLTAASKPTPVYLI